MLIIWIIGGCCSQCQYMLNTFANTRGAVSEYEVARVTKKIIATK